jgi:hypothetical protein
MRLNIFDTDPGFAFALALPQCQEPRVRSPDCHLLLLEMVILIGDEDEMGVSLHACHERAHVTAPSLASIAATPLTQLLPSRGRNAATMRSSSQDGDRRHPGEGQGGA